MIHKKNIWLTVICLSSINQVLVAFNEPLYNIFGVAGGALLVGTFGGCYWGLRSKNNVAVLQAKNELSAVDALLLKAKPFAEWWSHSDLQIFINNNINTYFQEELLKESAKQGVWSLSEVDVKVRDIKLKIIEYVRQLREQENALEVHQEAMKNVDEAVAHACEEKIDVVARVIKQLQYISGIISGAESLIALATLHAYIQQNVKDTCANNSPNYVLYETYINKLHNPEKTTAEYPLLHVADAIGVEIHTWKRIIGARMYVLKSTEEFGQLYNDGALMVATLERQKEKILQSKEYKSELEKRRLHEEKAHALAIERAQEEKKAADSKYRLQQQTENINEQHIALRKQEAEKLRLKNEANKQIIDLENARHGKLYKDTIEKQMASIKSLRNDMETIEKELKRYKQLYKDIVHAQQQDKNNLVQLQDNTAANKERIQELQNKIALYNTKLASVDLAIQDIELILAKKPYSPESEEGREIRAMQQEVARALQTIKEHITGMRGA